MKATRRIRLLSATAVVVVGSLWASNTTAVAESINPTADTASSVFSTQNASDWRSIAPALYQQGWPIQIGAITLNNGQKWATTVHRIQRGGTNFALFATPSGRLFAASENDATMWRVRNYYDNNTWTLASADDYQEQDENVLKFLWQLIELIAIITGVLGAGLMIIVAIVFILTIIADGLRDKMGKTQLELGDWTGDMSGADREYRTNPDFRGNIAAVPGLDVAPAMGWTMP